jgi:hypothetical protein
MTDDLTMLREARREFTDPDPVVLLRARRSLMRTALSRGRARRYRVRALTSVVAAAAALIVVGVAPWDGEGGASAEATSVLTRSASTIEDVPAPGPGQFAYTRSVQDEWYRDPATGSPATHRQEKRIHEAWVPADPSARLTVRITEAGTYASFSPVQTFSASRKRPRFYSSVPRDAQQMLDALRQQGATGDLRGDDAVMERATGILFDDLASPALRGAVVRAMTLIDGVQIVDADADLGDRRGVAIARPDDRTQVVFDPDTGEYLGARGVRAPTDWTGPDGATYINTVLERTIVDEAPTTR